MISPALARVNAATAVSNFTRAGACERRDICQRFDIRGRKLDGEASSRARFKFGLELLP
jgi:hypothetical protein